MYHIAAAAATIFLQFAGRNLCLVPLHFAEHRVDPVRDGDEVRFGVPLCRHRGGADAHAGGLLGRARLVRNAWQKYVW